MPAWPAKMQWSSGCSRWWPPTAEPAQKAQPAGLGCRQTGMQQQQLQGQSAATQWRGRPAGAATVGQLAALALDSGLVNRAADQLGRQRGGRSPQAGRRCSVRHAVCPFPLQVSVLQTTLLLHPDAQIGLTQLHISAETAVVEVPGRLGGGQAGRLPQEGVCHARCSKRRRSLAAGAARAAGLLAAFRTAVGQMPGRLHLQQRGALWADQKL